MYFKQKIDMHSSKPTLEEDLDRRSVTVAISAIKDMNCKSGFQKNVIYSQPDIPVIQKQASLRRYSTAQLCHPAVSPSITGTALAIRTSDEYLYQPSSSRRQS